MKKIFYLLFGVIAAGITMTACSDEPDVPESPYPMYYDSIYAKNGFEQVIIGLRFEETEGTVAYDDAIGSRAMIVDRLASRPVAKDYALKNRIVIPNSVKLDSTESGKDKVWVSFPLITVNDEVLPLGTYERDTIDGVVYHHFRVTGDPRVICNIPPKS